MSFLLQDLRYALRMLSRNRGLTAVAILTLALGSGANTAIFSILDPLLLQKLPVRQPDELVLVDAAGSLGDIGGFDSSGYERLRDESPAFSGVLSFHDTLFDNVTHDGRSSQARSEIVSGNYFDVLELPPYQGRLNFGAEELENSAVLGFDYWQQEFGADAGTIGKTLVVDGTPLRIVGITPPGFVGLSVGEATDIYILSSPPAKKFALGGVVIGRLKPGVSIEQGIVESTPAFEQIRRESGIPLIVQRQEMDHLVFSSAARGVSPVRSQFALPAWILMAVSALVLLIACANVANLLLAQGSARRREIAVRLAMGAGRKRLVRQLLTEGALLAIVGTAAGLFLARWSSRWIVASLSDFRTHVVLATPLSMRVLLFSLGGMAVTVLLCAVIPAFYSTRVEISHDIKIGSAGSRQGAAGSLGRMLVAGQVAMSVAALGAGGMLLHSLVNLEAMDAGFDRDHVVAVDMTSVAANRTAPQSQSFNDRLDLQVRSLPGVRSLAHSSFAPVSGRILGVNVHVSGYDAPSGEEPKAFIDGVTPGYFGTLGITLLKGRDFTLDDTPAAPPVCIINQSLARHYFAGIDPIGKRLDFVDARGSEEIVGVVADSKYYDLREETKDLVYLPFRADRVGGTLVVRSAGSPMALETELPKLIHSLEPTVQTARVETLRERIDDSLHVNRLIAALCGGFSILALILAGVGLYGILAFSVSRRTAEIGIRMALGADRNVVFRLILGQGMRLVALGLVAGSIVALASTGLLEKLLFGVGTGDPATFAGVCLLLAVISVLACYLPARRASRVDPLAALRNDG